MKTLPIEITLKMKKSLLFIVFGLIFHFVFAQQKDDRQLTAGFDRILSEQYKSNESGATVLVARRGQIIYKKALGMANLEYSIPMQLDNVFRIGSITKQFTAVAILQLIEQGKMNLEDEITKFIPDYPTHGYKITIEHLLTHTSGIKDLTEIKEFRKIIARDFAPIEVISYFKDQPMDFAPGTQYKYNNSGYFLLGYIIEKVSGKTYPQYVVDNFFKVLNMSNSLYGSDTKIIKNRADGYVTDSTGLINSRWGTGPQPYSAGSLMSTVEDLFKWHQAIHSYRLVKKEGLDKAFTKYRLKDSTEVNYGFGWRLLYIQDSYTIEHEGLVPGFRTRSIYLPQEDVFVAVFSNCSCTDPNISAVKIAALTIGKPYGFKEIAMDEGVWLGYAGVYKNKKNDTRFITIAENQLYLQTSGSAKNKLKAYQKDKFFFEDMMTTIDFIRNEKSEIVKLIIKGRQGNEVWDKTDKPIPAESKKN